MISPSHPTAPPLQFGNPDGKQSLEVSIGLPTFLLDKDNHNVILIVYLICLVVIIPTIVACWYGGCTAAIATIIRHPYQPPAAAYNHLSLALEVTDSHPPTADQC